MSAAVMSNYRSQLQVEHWMLAQMSHYPPPPPPPDQQHFNALYPAAAGTPQLLDHSQQNQLQFSSLNQPAFPKIEPATPGGQDSPQIQNLAEQLQNHAAQEEHQRQQIQQAAHRLQHHPQQHQSQPPQQPLPFHPQQTPVQPDASSDSQQPQKTNRLRKACDSCSIRKVKCDESGPPCRACAALDIPCTFERPSRRRGPPNRHAEAIKRRRLEESAGGAGSVSGTSTPSSPTHAAQALAALSSNPSNQHLTAESICPLETLNLLIDDFFTYIHPLCPFPHEPSFREAWKRREDVSNKSFLALLSSMIGALVASFPRKPRQHLKAQGKEQLFPNHMSLVHRCQNICSLARGPGYLESESLSVYDAATSYFLALMGIYTFRWRQGRLYFGECLTIVRTLGLHKSDHTPNASAMPSAVGSRVASQEGFCEAQQMDNITRQIGYRIFWTMFVSVRTVQQLGASFGELQIPPPTPTEPYPPLPDELDDFCIYPTHSDPQPPGLVPMIAGFNANVRVYSSYNPLATMEMAWGIDSIVDWERQKKVLYESLRRCKGAISELPPELIVYPNAPPLGQNGHGQSNGTQFFDGFSQQQMDRDPAAMLLNPTPGLPYGQEQSPEERRNMQYEIQKANIYASSLATRSYLVEKYWNLMEAHARSRSSQPPNSIPSSPGQGITAAGIDGMLPQAPTSGYDLTEHEFREEHEHIVKDLLVVLSNVEQVNMEPNADSFTMKIRAIASTLLDMPEQRKGQLQIQAQEYLHAFLNILMKLERVSPASSEAEVPDDESSELRHWADLREYQMKFAQQGGLMGFT